MRKILFAPAAILALIMVVPAHAGLIINATFDPDITAAEKATINQAIATYESLFSNNISVSIYYTGVTTGLGASSYFVYKESYGSFYTGLVDNNANPAAIADLTANGGNAITNGGVNPVTGNGSIELKSADSRALDPTGSLGLAQTPACQLQGSAGTYTCNGSSGPSYDGLVSVNTGLTNPGTPGSTSQYSLLAVVEHETDEVLGLGSALENTTVNCAVQSPPAACQTLVLNGTNDTIQNWNVPEPEDLWRFAADGTTRSFSANCASPAAAFFFLNAGTQIAQFDNQCDAGDFGDWQSDPLPNGVGPQVQDAYGTQGSTPTLGTSEIDALTAIGYDLSAPEPSTWVLLASSLCVLALVKRRQTRIA